MVVKCCQTTHTIVVERLCQLDYQFGRRPIYASRYPFGGSNRTELTSVGAIMNRLFSCAGELRVIRAYSESPKGTES